MRFVMRICWQPRVRHIRYASVVGIPPVEPIYRAASNAMLAHILPRALAFVRRREEGSGFETFSAVAATHCGRFFAATAAHCFGVEEDLRGYHILSASQPLSREPAGAAILLPGHVTAKVPCDVGLIELDQGFASRLGCDWIDVDDMRSGDPPPGRDLAFVGWPEDRVQPVGTRGAVVKPTLYCTMVAERNLYIYDDIAGCCNPKYQILAELPTEYSDGEGRPCAPDMTSSGMSGAGVFHFPAVRRSAIWTPSDTCLVGIDTAEFGRAKAMEIHRSEFIHDGLDEWVRGCLAPPQSPYS